MFISKWEREQMRFELSHLKTRMGELETKYARLSNQVDCPHPLRRGKVETSPPTWRRTPLYTEVCSSCEKTFGFVTKDQYHELEAHYHRVRAGMEENPA